MYDQQSFVKKIIGFFTWSSLILLIPLAALGFLSESSLPGNPLYTVKRGIEDIVLGFESFNANTKALYTVYLADKRFSETEKLLTSNTIQLNTSSTNDLLDQIIQARDTINQVSDANERLQLRKQLLQNITDYRSQLALLQNQVPQVQPTPSLPQTQSQQVTIVPTQQPSIPPTPQNQNGNGQINNLDQQLQQLQNQIQQDQNSNTYQQNSPTTPTPTVTPSPKVTPTGMPTLELSKPPSPTDTIAPALHQNPQSPTPTPTPSFIPTDTPTMFPSPTPTITPVTGAGPQFMHSQPTDFPSPTSQPFISLSPTPTPQNGQ